MITRNIIPIDDTSWGVQCSMDEVFCCHPWIPNGSSLVTNNGWFCRGLPKLALTSHGLDPLLLVWPSVGWGLLCWISWALISSRSTRSSSVDILPFFRMIHLLLRLGSPGSSLDRIAIINIFIEKLSSYVGDPYFNRDDCFNVVGKVEWCLSCWGSGHGSVNPQDAW